MQQQGDNTPFRLLVIQRHRKLETDYHDAFSRHPRGRSFNGRHRMIPKGCFDGLLPLKIYRPGKKDEADEGQD